MRNWDPKEESFSACSLKSSLSHEKQNASSSPHKRSTSLDEDILDAEWTATNILGLPPHKFKVVPFIREYWNDVFTDFLKDISHGLTPNPDILCNHRIKFKAFLNYVASRHGREMRISFGHYARNIDSKLYKGTMR